MNVQDLVNQSLTLAGRLGAGRSAGGAESNVVLSLANNMLDSWSTQRLAVYSIALNTWPLTAGTETYTIGPAGVFSGARPIVIESASIKYTIEGNTGHSPVKVLGQDDFTMQARMGDQAVLPRTLYNDQAWPLSTLYLYPIPATNTHLELYTWQPFTQFTAPVGTVNTLGTAVTWVSGPVFDPGLVGQSITINNIVYTVASVTSGTALVLTATAGTQTGVAYSVTVFLGSFALPPGYARAVSYNLAVEIASAFGLKVPDAVAEIARQAKASIEAINARLMPEDEMDRSTAVPDRSNRTPGK